MSDKCIAIIDELIELRKAKGLTQRELAKATNLAQPAIARLERKAAIPQLDTLLKVAAALDYELELVPHYQIRIDNPLQSLSLLSGSFFMTT